MLHKFNTTIGKRHYIVIVNKYEKNDKNFLEIEYVLQTPKGVVVTEISDSLDMAVWQDIQFEMKGREHANRIF